MIDREEMKEALGDYLCEYCPLKDYECESKYCDMALDLYLEED